MQQLLGDLDGHKKVSGPPVANQCVAETYH